MFAVMWSTLEQSPRQDGMAYQGDSAAFLCIVHSLGGLLSFTDWLLGGNADFLGLWSTL